MRRLLVLALLLGLVVTGAALAGRGDPQKRIAPADQARAKAMLLRKTDSAVPYRVTRLPDTGDFYCKALDESDLTLTGEAQTDLVAPPELISSLAQVYETVADANRSWRRGTSPAGESCVRKEFAKDGGLISFKRKAFPRLAQRSIAYRAIGTTQGVRFYLDLVVLQQSRAQAGLAFASAPTPFPHAEEVRLARIVAGRMVNAMRR